MKMRFSGLLVGILCLSFSTMAFAKNGHQPQGKLFFNRVAQERLGKLIYEDPAFSAGGNQSCQSCHHPKAQFSDPVNRISPMYRPVSQGSDGVSFGGRNAPPAAYAAYSPSLYYDAVEGLFFGGLFWDGRASGRMDISGTGDLGAGPTGVPLADQAKGPFGNPLEMALVDETETKGPSTEEKVVAITKKKYAKEYNKAFGNIYRDETGVIYNNIALAIAAFEQSRELNKFSSKFDRFREEQRRKRVDVSLITLANAAKIRSNVYTREEIEGLALFNTEADGNVEDFTGGGGCFLCHPVPAANATEAEAVFTDFSYDNLGIPVNPAIEGLAGPQGQDLGLGSQEAILQGAYSTVMGEAMPDTLLQEQKGKFKVSSLRNIARTAPYGHNGFFPTLYDIVHFYNTRDVLAWGPSEVAETVNGEELGDLGLTFAEEQKIVVFLETLTDE